MLQNSDIISGNEDFTIMEEAPIWVKYFQIDDLYKMFLEKKYIYIYIILVFSVCEPFSFDIYKARIKGWRCYALHPLSTLSCSFAAVPLVAPKSVFYPCLFFPFGMDRELTDHSLLTYPSLTLIHDVPACFVKRSDTVLADELSLLKERATRPARLPFP